MRRDHLPVYTLALALVAAGAIAIGLPVGTLVAILIVLVCPLMLFVIMRGMDYSGHEGHDDSTPSDQNDDVPPHPAR